MTRIVEVAPERLARWLDGFAERNGGLAERVDHPADTVIRAVDGSVAEIEVPFPPVAGDLVAHALASRRVGVVLVRLGGYAVGVFDGTALVVSKCGSRLVHGRNKAGGQSQQRFARRRENQVRQAIAAATDTAARVLTPYVGSLDAMVTGGDRTALRDVLADGRLAGLRPLVVDRVLAVPEPRLVVLQRTPEQFRSVRIRLTP